MKPATRRHILTVAIPEFAALFALYVLMYFTLR